MEIVLPILSTLYYPDLNPVGPTSLIIAIGVTIALLCRCCSEKWANGKYPEYYHVMPWILMAVLLLCPGSWFMTNMHKFQTADSCTAVIILVTVGFVLSIRNLASPNRFARGSATLLSLSFGLMIAYHVSDWLLTGRDLAYHNRYEFITYLWSYGGIGAIWIALFDKQSRKAKLNRLRDSGHCRKCSYNLKGNTSGVCPECGEPIENRNEL